MTKPEEKQLFEALRGPLQYQERVLNEEADQIAILDVYAITPAVEEMLLNAELRGRLQLLLEQAAKIWERRERAA